MSPRSCHRPITLRTKCTTETDFVVSTVVQNNSFDANRDPNAHPNHVTRVSTDGQHCRKMLNIRVLSYTEVAARSQSCPPHAHSRYNRIPPRPQRPVPQGLPEHVRVQPVSFDATNCFRRRHLPGRTVAQRTARCRPVVGVLQRGRREEPQKKVVRLRSERCGADLALHGRGFSRFGPRGFVFV